MQRQREKREKERCSRHPADQMKMSALFLTQGLICGRLLSHNVSHSLRIIDIRDTWSHKIHKVSFIRSETHCELYSTMGTFNSSPDEWHGEMNRRTYLHMCNQSESE